MNGKKVAFIIPGFYHSPYRKIYKSVHDSFVAQDFKVVFVSIHWKHTTPSQWIAQFTDIFNKEKGERNYLFGFSYGALIAFVAATSLDIDTQILCSLSPYFQEDLPVIKASWKKGVGKRRVAEFEKLNNTVLAKKIRARTYLLYGTKEGDYIYNRAHSTYADLSTKKEIIPVEGARHDIGDLNYSKHILRLIENL